MFITIANDIYLSSTPKAGTYVGEIPQEFRSLVYKATSNLVTRVPGDDPTEANNDLTAALRMMQGFLLSELYTFQYMPGSRIASLEETLNSVIFETTQ